MASIDFVFRHKVHQDDYKMHYYKMHYITLNLLNTKKLFFNLNGLTRMKLWNQIKSFIIHAVIHRCA